jgi:hypothetical protein
MIHWEPVSATALLLMSFVTDPSPWLSIQAGSEQRPPVYLGATARELALGLSPVQDSHASLTRAMKETAEITVREIARQMGEKKIEIELWPTQNDQGTRTWAYARWRANSTQPWQWIDAEYTQAPSIRKLEPVMFFPETYRTWIKREHSKLFDDFLTFKGPDALYTKPLHGFCVWTNEEGTEIYRAWAPLGEAEQLSKAAAHDRAVCHALPQPARLNGKPVTLVLGYNGDDFTWHGTKIRWISEFPSERQPKAQRPKNPISSFATDFDLRYADDLLSLDGEREATFDGSGAKVRFVRKNSADPDNQLFDLMTDKHMVAFLEARYASLGIKTWRQIFAWRGIPQANLIAVLPGTAPDHDRRPVLVADHYDTAFCEDVFATSKNRVSAPGADDNVSAVAALLRAAETLRDLPHDRDIWLVHLTGEEFPGDDLGARALASQLLAEGRDISGLLVMDMIGWHKRGDGLFQINAGASADSLEIAGMALGAAIELAPQNMVPVVRTRFDDHSYLFNTDAVIFSDSGFPVVLFNEHINYLENLNRAGYHQTTDTSAKIDFGFAASIARIAIQTALSLANAPSNR